MPRTACIHTTAEERAREEWTVERELLALLTEITSVAASEQKLRKPVKIPRPDHVKQRARAASRQEAFDRGFALMRRTQHARKGVRGDRPAG